MAKAQVIQPQTRDLTALKWKSILNLDGQNDSGDSSSSYDYTIGHMDKLRAACQKHDSDHNNDESSDDHLMPGLNRNKKHPKGILKKKPDETSSEG